MRDNWSTRWGFLVKDQQFICNDNPKVIKKIKCTVHCTIEIRRRDLCFTGFTVATSLISVQERNNFGTLKRKNIFSCLYVSLAHAQINQCSSAKIVACSITQQHF